MVYMILMMLCTGKAKMLRTFAIVTTFHLCRHSAGYVFAPLIKKELEEFRILWNNHRIRRNRLAGCPAGIPDDIYHLVGGEGILLYLKVHANNDLPASSEFT